MRDIVTTSGFTITDETGLFHGERLHHDGRRQIMQVFYWSNPKIAANQGIPHGYLAIRANIDVGNPDIEYAGHLRLPTYEWPATNPQRRPWPEVVTEFRKTLQPIWDLPLTSAQKHLEALPSRNRIT
jgi:hypothetical protein